MVDNEIIRLEEVKTRFSSIENLMECKGNILIRAGKYRNMDVNWIICDIDVDKEQILLIAEKVVTFFEYGLHNIDTESVINTLENFTDTMLVFNKKAEEFLVPNESGKYVWLLSVEEVKNYLTKDQIAAKALDDTSKTLLQINDRCYWLLRQNENDKLNKQISYVDAGGGVSSIKIDEIVKKGYGIRPACWLNFAKL